MNFFDNFYTESRAGLTTFLAMVYIIPLNALIMSQAGMPYEALITATALLSLIATVANGVYANTPIALSVGMGLNTYFTFGLVKGLGMSWQSALAVVFISGLLFFILTLTPFRKMAIQSLPIDLRRAISAGIGSFIAFIGLKQMGVIVADPVNFVHIGHLGEPTVLLGIGTFFILLFLHVKKITGGFLISILAGASVAWILGFTEIPTSIFSMPASIAPIAFELDFSEVFKLSIIPVILAFMVADMFDSIGTLTGVGGLIFEDEEKLEKTLQVDAAASALGGLLGVSTVTSFIESATGVEEGGRRGLSVVVTGILFGLSVFLLPLFSAIHPNAIYPVLILVGILMFSEVHKIDFSDFAISASAFMMIMIMPLSFSIATGLASGLLTYLFIRVVKLEFDKISLGLVILSLLSGLIFFV